MKELLRYGIKVISKLDESTKVETPAVLTWGTKVNRAFAERTNARYYFCEVYTQGMRIARMAVLYDIFGVVPHELRYRRKLFIRIVDDVVIVNGEYSFLQIPMPRRVYQFLYERKISPNNVIFHEIRENLPFRELNTAEYEGVLWITNGTRVFRASSMPRSYTSAVYILIEKETNFAKIYLIRSGVHALS